MKRESLPLKKLNSTKNSSKQGWGTNIWIHGAKNVSLNILPTFSLTVEPNNSLSRDKGILYFLQKLKNIEDIIIEYGQSSFLWNGYIL